MTILMWDKPAKAKTVEEWKTDAGFDGGPAGGYVPNMRIEDAYRWKAKVVGKTTDHPQVEIRKSFATGQLVLIVSLGNGYNYKFYKVDPARHEYNTKGVNVHMATNGGLQMSFQDVNDMHAAVTEAREYLETLTKKDTPES